MLPELNGTSGLEGARPFAAGPRINLRKTHPGFHHPAGKQEIIQFLDSIDPIALYGLRVVEVARRPAVAGRASPVFGR
jgi:hypothetical protein